MKKHTGIFLAFTCFTLNACASIVSGTSQNIAVDTSPSNAECRLSNDKGEWFVDNTPGTTVVHRSSQALTVECHKGKLQAIRSFDSHTKGAAYGNILAGGIIGAAVDMGNGAAYDYPPSVSLKLKK